MCAILYFSGVYWLYVFFRKRVLKERRSIVLTYHRIRDDDTDPDISVSTRCFEQQLAFLKERFNLVSLSELVRSQGQSTHPGRDNVALTFDDGYEDNYLNAFPVLKRSGLSATIFLVSQFINGKAEFLRSEQIMEMKGQHISFGSHTATHQVLSEINPEAAKEEIINSKRELEGLLNEEVAFFAYPKGKNRHVNVCIKDQVKTAGYRAAFTTENGRVDPQSDLFSLKRIGIRNCPLFVFKVRVSGIFESRVIYWFRGLIGMR